jgi:hypothetical protein
MDAARNEGERCYAGDPQAPDCPGFITEDDFLSTENKRDINNFFEEITNG